MSKPEILAGVGEIIDHYYPDGRLPEPGPPIDYSKLTIERNQTPYRIVPVAIVRPPRETYVRCSVEHGGFTFEPAVEWRDGDGFYEMVEKLEAIALDRWRPRGDAMLHAKHIGQAIAGTWPDRAYFVEVWQDGKRGFAQVFQPFGLPRNQPFAGAEEMRQEKPSTPSP